MARDIDRELLLQELSDRLRTGPRTSRQLREDLGVSQSTVSRLLSSMGAAITHLGARRSARYALTRDIPGVQMPLRVVEIAEDGRATTLGMLHAINPDDFFFEDVVTPKLSCSYQDLPYFIQEMRPDGYLGRLIPHMHQGEYPHDISSWTASHCLHYLASYGWDTVGNLIVGDRALERYLRYAQTGPQKVALEHRAQRYCELADETLNQSLPGSSAGGEQAKFLTWVEGATVRPVLVKFSPPRDNPVGERVADLLVAEHLALDTLRAGGISAAQSELVIAGERVFLELTRFDRCGILGRRGVISLGTLDAEFVGAGKSWSKSAAKLADLGVIQESHVGVVRSIELFGELIANTDMHGGNFSFFTKGTKPLHPTPVYDMGPALFAPVSNQLVRREFEAPVPTVQDAPHWHTIFPLALAFWDAVQQHPEISSSFKAIAKRAQHQISSLEHVGSLLPR